MNKYAVFLRGINLGGKNKIDMTELKQILTDEGFLNVITYLNSGNVILDNASSNLRAIERQIKSLIEQQFRINIDVIVRTMPELETILNYDTFSAVENSYVVLLSAPSEIDISTEVNKVKSGEDKLHINKTEVHLLVPGGYGKTKLTNGFFEKKLKVTATTRNIKTIQKVYSMMVK